MCWYCEDLVTEYEYEHWPINAGLFKGAAMIVCKKCAKKKVRKR